ncbi:MAG: Hsp20/alpha crystallin family protein [Cyclobacteriaceae bacterium]
MTLIKRNTGLFPSTPSFFDDFLTKDFINWGMSPSRTSSLPAVNIHEEEGKYTVEVAVPGLKKDDFHVEIDNNILTISTEKEDRNEDRDQKGNYTRREFSYTSFSRSFTLPEEVIEVDKVNARYENGVLSLDLPKKEAAKPKPVKTIKIS